MEWLDALNNFKTKDTNLANQLEKYKEDFKKLKDLGLRLELRMQADLFPVEIRKQVENQKNAKEGDFEKFLAGLPDFNSEYQHWYSESLALLRQLLPDRVSDFVSLYEPAKNRKAIEFGSYVMLDYLQGMTITRYGKENVDGKSALPQFRIQRRILNSVEKRFESSLFEIATLVQADLLDSEIEAAQTLLKNKFVRAAGAIAGVVLEAHLKSVMESHQIRSAKKNITISVANDALKDANLIDVAQWRFIQHLGDIRNLCDHKKQIDPTSDQVSDLIYGVEKVTKTIF